MFTMKPNIGLNLRVTGHCNQGGRKYMEDAFVVGYQQSENLKELVYAYFGIFDGHGGKEAALFAKENLMNNIVCQKGFWSDDDSQVLKAIREGFLATHDAMWKEVDNWPKTVSGLPSTSGTTSSIAFIRKQKLYIGHVGDSKIVLGWQLPDSNDWFAHALTKDHKPESPEEKKRIDSVGGLVLKKAGVQRVVWNRPNPGHKGPIRRSTPVEQIPFLAVSRSLGDLWSFNYTTNEFVVSPDPDVEVIELNPRVHRCIIFGSDGLWNMISAQAAVRIVQKTDEENEKIILEGGRASDTEKQLNNPSRLLVDTALKYWFDFGMRADNISVVTVMLDPPGPCKREVLLRQRVMKRLRPRDEQSIAEDEAAVKDASLSNIKDKKRSFDSVESPKERKLSEPPCKERKLLKEASEPSVPKNLPKPVILSPIKVIKPKSPAPSDPTSSKPELSVTSSEDSVINAEPVINQQSPIIKSDNCNSTLTIMKSHTTSHSTTEVADSKMMKKGHDPPVEALTSKFSENENQCADVPSNMQSKSKFSGRTGESSESDCFENAKDTTISPSNGKNNLVCKIEKNDCPYQINTNSKENGRVHLCEVDNFLKLNRTPDCSDSKNVRSKTFQKTDNIISPKTKNFRKSTLSCRSSTVRKRYITLRKPRLQTNMSMCRTRAQSNIQKLKV